MHCFVVMQIHDATRIDCFRMPQKKNSHSRNIAKTIKNLKNSFKPEKLSYVAKDTLQNGNQTKNLQG